MKKILSLIAALAAIVLSSPLEASASDPAAEQSFDSTSSTCAYYPPPESGASCSEIAQYCADQYLYNCCSDSCGGEACAIQTQQQYEQCLYRYRCRSRPPLPQELPC